ncbi:MAG: hypothetical protein JNL08_06815 [Planctomycetes bacterium]|nr:hypothetical protein [Planctomycetota bacterium]
MKPSLKSLPKWLFLPPAVALLLVLGPLSMQGSTDKPTPAGPAVAPVEAGAVPNEERATTRPSPAVPRTPDLWQVGSALAAVLLLGGAGIVLLRRLRGGAVPVRGGTPVVTLRQTLRLSPRQAVHALEFDDRILLVGEHERGLVLLESGRAAARDDESTVAARAAELEPHDDGAVPKNLVIPRPPQAAPRPQVQPPRAATPGLNDFRALLQKVGR